MFNKSLLTAATLLCNAAAQSWEVAVFEPSAGGSIDCTGGGTTISGSDTNCHTVGLGSNAASFNIDLGGTVNPPGATWVFFLFADNNCEPNSLLQTQFGPGMCFTGSVGSFEAQSLPNPN
ncbi:hypothetical protein DFH06DRAFT_1323677 [Mycena polygramma]|nr:hypothetical protein DFH06DRAFT_1323677 [Mycena polygramma]